MTPWREVHQVVTSHYWLKGPAIKNFYPASLILNKQEIIFKNNYFLNLFGIGSIIVNSKDYILHIRQFSE